MREWSHPLEVRFSGAVDAVDLGSVPLDESMLRHVAFEHAQIRGVELTMDELSFLAYWSSFEDCVFRQRSKRLHPEGWEPGGQLAWRPTVYRRCRFVGLRLRSNNGFNMLNARFEDCVFERCKWRINLTEVDMLRCRIVGPVASVVFFGHGRGIDGGRRDNVIEDNDFTEAVLSNNIGFRHGFPIGAQRWPAGFTPEPDPEPDLPDPFERPEPEAATGEVPWVLREERARRPAREPEVEVLTPAPAGIASRAPSGQALSKARPRSMVMAVDTLEVPVRGPGTGGNGSAVRALGDGTIVTTWIEGVQAIRLARIDPLTGTCTVLKGARGELRDVVPDPQRERAWLLMTHGLHEVTLDPFTIRRTLTKPLGAYQHAALRLDDDVILVTRAIGHVAQLVSTARMEVVGRVRVRAPELAVPSAAGTRVFGFGSRQARTLTPDHRLSGKPHPLPLGRDPIATGQGIAFLPALSGPRFNERAGDSDVVAADSVAIPAGHVAFLDEPTLAVDATGPGLGIGGLHGTDPAGRLIASDLIDAHGPGTTLALLDAGAQHTEGVVTLPAQLDAIVSVPGLGAVIRPFEGHRTPKTMWVARWNQGPEPT